MVRRLLAVSMLALSVLAGCGGGGADGDGASTAPPLAAMVDSFGQAVPESFAGGGDAGAAGGDGTAGDGAPIVHAPVTVTDAAGRSVTGQTDQQGYYRVRIDGFVPPMIASVLRPDGSRWYSPSVAPVKVRGFITMNMTGLTDKLASDVAAASGLDSAAQLTPAILQRNPGALQTAKTNLNNQLARQLADAGLNPASFDPVSMPFRPDLTGYDKVLESVAITKPPQGGTTTVTTMFALGGVVAGLGSQGGLALANGAEVLQIAAGTTDFRFGALLAASTAYAVTVASQPAGLTCAVANASGSMGAGDRLNLLVSCSPVTYVVGGTVSGLGHAAGLVLADGTRTVQVAPGAASFSFAEPVPQGTRYAVSVQAQPAGLTCSVSNATGTVSGANVSVPVMCSPTAFRLGGLVTGLTTSGLVLSGAGQTVSVPANAGSFVFPATVVAGTLYEVQVQNQPAAPVRCQVGAGSGAMPASDRLNVVVSCGADAHALGGTIGGLGNRSGLILANGTETRVVPAGATAFTFSGAIPVGQAYAVSIVGQPGGATCSVSQASGVMGPGPVASVAVMCSPNAHALGGSFTGLSTPGELLAGLVLTAAGQTVGIPDGATSFAFPSPVVAGTQYDLRVQSQPSNTLVRCYSTGPYTMPDQAVATAEVHCHLFQGGLFGVVTGLENATGTPFTIETGVGGQQPLVGQTYGNFLEYRYDVYQSVGYDVSVQVPGYTCTTTNGGGITDAGAVRNVATHCTRP